MQHDKKANEQGLRLVLLHAPGQPVTVKGVSVNDTISFIKGYKGLI
jgi:3-dehydroquinate synthetase